MFKRLAKSSLRPIEIGRKLVRSIDAGRTPGADGKSVAPNSFVVHLNESDRAALGDLEKHLVTELIDAAKQYTEDEGYKVAGEINVSIVTDAAMKAAIGVGLGDMQAAFDKRMDEKYGKMRAALKEPAEGVNPAKMTLEEVKVYGAANPDNFIAQMALGVQLRKVGDFEGAVAAWEDQHHLLLRLDDPAGAGRATAMVAMFLMIDTGLMAPVRGWIRRAEALLSEGPREPAQDRKSTRLNSSHRT